MHQNAISVHLEQNALLSTFSLKEEEDVMRLGVRGGGEEPTTDFPLSTEWQGPRGDSKLKLRLFQAAYRMCLQM